MNTPPRTRTRPTEAPPTPLHGARFDSPPPTARKSKGPSSHTSSTSHTTATLSPPPSSPLGPSSPEPPRKSRKRRASALDEPADKPVEVESEGWKELEKMFGKDFGRSGGLPTPAKTPARKKKHLSIEAVGGSARRLFGSQSFVPGGLSGRSRKGAGRLSLFGEEEEEEESISIFTDNNVRIPKFDPSPENPFITRPGEARRKKLERKMKKGKGDDTLGEEGEREDGMVYIFRGKKMFRKFSEMDEIDDPLPKKLVERYPKALPAFFDDEEEGEEEEEEEVEEEVGAEDSAKLELSNSEDEEEEEEESTKLELFNPEKEEESAKLELFNPEEDEEEFDEEEDEEIMRILNKRSSIRPRLLFPSKEAEEDSPSEEEAETDIEEAAEAIIVKKKVERSAISRLTPDSDEEFQPQRTGRRVKFDIDDDLFGPGTIPKSTRKAGIFSGKRSSIFDEKKPSKRASIFDEKSSEKTSIFDEETSERETSTFDDEPLEKLAEGAGKEKRKRARGGSLDAPGAFTPRKEKKTRGTKA